MAVGEGRKSQNIFASAQLEPPTSTGSQPHSCARGAWEVPAKSMLLKKLLHQPSARSRILKERLTEPMHLNLTALTVAVFGGFRAKVSWDLVNRPHYAYGLLEAADQARQAGLNSFTAVEFGVAGGEGLLNLCLLAERVTAATGVQVRIVGFDSGQGMPPPVDWRDHPEQFGAGDFAMD